MHKTSVYLSDEEVEGLRRVAAASGQSQAELIRAGVRKIIEELGSRPRTFRSLGRGRGGGQPYEPWSSVDLYKRVLGER